MGRMLSGVREAVLIEFLYVVHCVLGEFVRAFVGSSRVNLEFVAKGVVEGGWQGPGATKRDGGVVNHVSCRERGCEKSAHWVLGLVVGGVRPQCLGWVGWPGCVWIDVLPSEDSHKTVVLMSFLFISFAVSQVTAVANLKDMYFHRAPPE